MKDLCKGVKHQKPEQLHHIDPLALLALGRVYAFGGEKYEDAYNYLKGYDFSLSYDAMWRHMLLFWSGEDRDAESGEFHVLHAAFHCLTLASFLLRDVGDDDRPPRAGEGNVARLSDHCEDRYTPRWHKPRSVADLHQDWIAHAEGSA